MGSRLTMILFAPALVLAAACSKDKPADASLNADLALAAQANTARMDSISAAERMNAAAPVAAKPAASTTRRTTTTRSASSGRSNTTVAAEPRYETTKNTKRDAAIGGAAGAIIGAATSRDKLKGAIIGGAAGAILGGVIGNNVDVQKKRVP